MDYQKIKSILRIHGVREYIISNEKVYIIAKQNIDGKIRTVGKECVLDEIGVKVGLEPWANTIRVNCIKIEYSGKSKLYFTENGTIKKRFEKGEVFDKFCIVKTDIISTWPVRSLKKNFGNFKLKIFA